MNGIEACKAMREFEHNSRRTSAAIFGLTANPLDDYAEGFLQAGMDMHLSKPLRLWELKEVLRRWIKLEPAQAPQQTD